MKKKIFSKSYQNIFKHKVSFYENNIDEKLNFTAPFMRFWFSFISPYFKGIKDGVPPPKKIVFNLSCLTSYLSKISFISYN